MNLPKAYDANSYEHDIYDLWERSGVFIADNESKKDKFSIAMPPPNETGTLSLGHALFLTLQDILARHARFSGKDVLWLPGTDHAALAVNAVMEKQLATEGTNKHEVGRDEFLRRTREFVGQSRVTMIGQMRAMGASADWTRLRYTLDESLNRMVNETFKKMYDEGLLYRGHRIVNWDPNLETNVSDDEVNYVEENTTLYTFQYGPFQISTARPETKFGDKYVVMHPEDGRYTQYKHGDTFDCEWINGLITATIIKDEAIDMSFGTGVMTITPWHDHTDFEIAERHKLDKEQIIDLRGALMPIAGDLAGLPIETARGRIVEILRKKGLVVKEEPYTHNVAINERGKGKIEPQIMLQWFVDVNKPVVNWKRKKQSLKTVMREVIDSGDITITPKRFEKTYFNWIDNLRDWCVTRQIWWGHRVPVWYRSHTDGTRETYVGVQAPLDDGLEGFHAWEQDPDTLDTWFSAALWTWSTLIDTEKSADYSLSLEDLLKLSPDFQKYHPTDVMETGWDIIFFWVARMILSTTFMTGQVPFKRIYLHGMVRAEDGKKMSKSKPEGIIDPLTVIPQYGTDALRAALIWGTSAGQDFNWSTPKIETTRNFANKLWNIARYIEGVVGDARIDYTTLKPQTSADHWILNKLSVVAKKSNKDIEALNSSEYFDSLYHFVWDDLADWYIEASKSEQNPTLLAYVLDGVLKLLHPAMPFVTETIWQTLDLTGTEVLAQQSWPNYSKLKLSKEQALEFEQIITVVSEVRFITSRLGVQKCTLYYKAALFLGDNAPLITKLAKLAGVKQVESGQGMHLTSTTYDCWLDIDSHTARQFVAKLEADKQEKEQSIARLEARLGNEGYVKKAPKKIVEETKSTLVTEKELLAKLEAEIATFTQG